MIRKILCVLSLLLAGPALAQVGQRAAPFFTGTTAGTQPTYTMAAPVPASFGLIDQSIVRAKVHSTNTGAATLNVQGTGALAIARQTDGGLVQLVGGELVAGNQYDFVYQASCAAPISANCFVVTTITAAGITAGATSATVSQAQWAAGHVFVVTAASQTFTLPVATSLPGSGGIIIQTVGVTTTLQPNAADGVNGGSVGVAITIPADATVIVTTSGSSGTAAIDAPLGPVQYFPISWGAGQNLAAATVGISIGRVATPRTIIGLRCRPDVVVGGTATIAVYTAANNAAFSSGIKLNTTDCNANTGAGAEQDLGIASASVPAGYWIGIVATGAGWTSSAGYGAVNVSFR